MSPSNLLEHIGELSSAKLVIFVLIAMLVDTIALVGLLVPGDVVVLVPSAAIATGDAWMLFVAATIGTVCGYNISYTIGRLAGPAVRRSWLGRRVPDDRWELGERLVRGPGGSTLAVVQFLPVINCVLPLLAGTLGVARWRFIRLTTLSTLMWSGTYVVLGSTAGGAGEAVADARGQLIALVLISAPAALIGYLLLARAARQLEAEPPAQVKDTSLDEDPTDVADSSTC